MPIGKKTDKIKEIEEQYIKIYRYCYFKLQRRELAEDITQETFLRFLESENYHNEGKELRYLYTIARNLCIDEYRKRQHQGLIEEFDDKREAEKNVCQPVRVSGQEEEWITTIAVRDAFKELEEEERELVLLRYVNEVPISVICNLYQMSRFSVYRRLKRILRNLEEKLGEPQKAVERNAIDKVKKGGLT